MSLRLPAAFAVLALVAAASAASAESLAAPVDQITVTTGGSQVSVQRGAVEQKYACVQRCEAAPR